MSEIYSIKNVTTDKVISFTSNLDNAASIIKNDIERSINTEGIFSVSVKVDDMDSLKDLVNMTGCGKIEFVIFGFLTFSYEIDIYNK